MPAQKRRSKPRIRQAPLAASIVLDGSLESSLLLVDHLWAQVAQQLEGHVVAAVPSRDTLIVTGSEVPGGIAALRRAVDGLRRRSATRLLLTKSLLVRRDGSWQQLQPDPCHQ